MVNTNWLSQLYGEVDTLTMFKHPVTNRSYEYLSMMQIIELASQTLEYIKDSGYQHIIVSETGANPFTYICEQLAKQQGLSLSWVYVKFPREPLSDISFVLKFYLTAEEQTQPLTRANQQLLKRFVSVHFPQWQLPYTSSRLELLKSISQKFSVPRNLIKKPNLSRILTEIEKKHSDPLHQLIQILFHDTDIQTMLAKPFLYFDEYVDSGTTLRNAAYYFQLFTPRVSFKIGCYFIFEKTPKNYPMIQFSLFNQSQFDACFQQGVYPFENRLDLIGHWFFITNTGFKKQCVSRLITKKNTIKNDFRERLFAWTKTSHWMETVKAKMSLLPMQDFFHPGHLVRFSFYVLEKYLLPKSVTIQFWQDSFEMYAPIWSPLPDEYHLDFTNAFYEQEAEIFEDLTAYGIPFQYLEIRKSLLSGVARVYEARRHQWIANVNKSLKEFYVKS